MALNTNYDSFATIPLKANFLNLISGNPVDIIFDVVANASLSSATVGMVKFSVYNGGTSTVANSTLNGTPFPLAGLYMNAYSTSGNYAYYEITEGLSGGTVNALPYDVNGYYKLEDVSNNINLIIPFTYTFYVNPIGPLDPR